MNSGIKILITGKMSDESLVFLKKDFIVEYAPGLSGESLFHGIHDAKGLIIRTETPVTRELLSHAKKLEVICRSGIGIDHIDLTACSERKIAVMNTPAANRVSAAEHTMALILALSRHIPQATTALKSGRWDRDHFTGSEISHKTLGILGLGNIGQRVAARAKAFEMNVIAHDPYLKASVAEAAGVKLLSLNEVLEKSDYVSLHVPLTDETKNMVNDNFLGKMKKSSYLINTSRGKVVSEAALIEALEKKQIKGAALDVFETEPISPKNPLLKFENLIVTPHIAGQTMESQMAMGMDAARQVHDFLKNGTVVNEVLKL